MLRENRVAIRRIKSARARCCWWIPHPSSTNSKVILNWAVDLDADSAETAARVAPYELRLTSIQLSASATPFASAANSRTTTAYTGSMKWCQVMPGCITERSGFAGS